MADCLKLNLPSLYPYRENGSTSGSDESILKIDGFQSKGGSTQWGGVSVLLRAQLVLRTDEKGWVLARDLRQVTLAELYNSDAYVLPDEGQVKAAPDALNNLITKINNDLQKTMDLPLDELL